MAEEGSGAPGGGPRLRAVLFDVGGTLLHMPRAAEEILAELCLRMGLAISPDEARAACRASERFYSRHYLGYTGNQGSFWHRYHSAALEQLGIEDPDGKRAEYLSHGFGREGVWRAYPDAPRVCERLRAAGIRLAAVSNGPATVRDLLEQAGLLPFFDAVLASQALGIEKPDPRVFQAALEAVGVDAGEAVFVGDLYDVDVVGARAAGIVPVLIDRGGGPARDCMTVRSLEELPALVEKL